MQCPRCGRPSNKYYSPYCTKVHKLLDEPPKHLQLECAACNRPVIRLRSQTKGKVFCPRCSKNVGESHPSWKDGQYINPAGYRLLLVKGAYKLEHRHTWEQANRACILPQAHGIVAIHHINLSKLDNRPQNLVMLSSQAHGRIHRLIDAGRFDEAKCELISWLEQQAFFLQHLEYLEAIQNTSLQDILSTA